MSWDLDGVVTHVFEDRPEVVIQADIRTDGSAGDGIETDGATTITGGPVMVRCHVLYAEDPGLSVGDHVHISATP